MCVCASVCKYVPVACPHIKFDHTKRRVIARNGYSAENPRSPCETKKKGGRVFERQTERERLRWRDGGGKRGGREGGRERRERARVRADKERKGVGRQRTSFLKFIEVLALCTYDQHGAC